MKIPQIVTRLLLLVGALLALPACTTTTRVVEVNRSVPVYYSRPVSRPAPTGPADFRVTNQYDQNQGR